jgi:hypothetical protein
MKDFTRFFIQKILPNCIKLCTLYFFLFLSTAYCFSPQPGSPLSKRVHPRLHLTQQTILDLRELISDHYSEKYQAYINWAASSGSDKGGISGTGHDVLRAVVVHQAFIAALGRVDGITYPISIQTYADRAIKQLIDHLNSGDTLGYVAALTYDWTYNYMTNSQRSQIANIMRARSVDHKVFDHSIAEPEIAPEQMFSSKYFEGCYAWYVALAFWGDGLIDADADRALDTFENVMLNYGYLDAHNFVAGDGGGWSEWSGYSSWHPRTHILLVDAWRTATGEDYIAGKGTIEGNAIKNFPKFMAYAIDPHEYFNDHYTWVRMGGSEAKDISLNKKELWQQVFILPRVLSESGLQHQAGLLQYIIDTYKIPQWLSYEYTYIWRFLGLAKNIATISPSSLNFEKSQWSKNLGVFIARTGFSSAADGVFSVEDSHYRFAGHAGADDFPGFTLAKFGCLVNGRVVAHRGYGNVNSYPGAHSDNIIYFEGNHRLERDSLEKPSELRDAIHNAGDYDHGGIEQVTRKDGQFYHVHVNRSPQFKDGVRHTREYVWLPGSNPADDSDYLVVYDRTFAPSKPEWVYHVPWKPAALNYDSKKDISTGSGESDRIGHAYTGKDIVIKELNGLGGERDSDGGDQDYVGGAGAHGVMFCKTVFPAEARVEVTRVASLDSQVMKRQEHLAIKTHRWQISVKPVETKSNHVFLHVFQTSDAEKRTHMVDTSDIQAGAMFHGVWINRETTSRPNYVVLLNQEENMGPAVNGVLFFETTMSGAHTFSISVAGSDDSNYINYSLSGQGLTKHVIVGLEPNKTYEIVDNGSVFTKSTERDIETWNSETADDDNVPAAPQHLRIISN